MTLFKKIQELIEQGYSIEFSRHILFVQIDVRFIGNKLYIKSTRLPISEHFTEDRIVDCIDWSIAEIDKAKEANANT